MSAASSLRDFILPKPPRRFLACALRSALCAVLALSGGCGSATVLNEAPAASRPIIAPNRPAATDVGDFDLGSATVEPKNKHGPLALLHKNRGPSDEVAKLQEVLVNETVSHLKQAGMRAARLDTATSRPTEGWLVTGEFLEIAEGNRAVRAVVGFGAGDSSAKLYVTLADLSHPKGQSLLAFNADTNGEKAPGGSVTAVAEHSPWGMVAKYAIDRNASEKDMTRLFVSSNK
jgi:hypothetical protein